MSVDPNLLIQSRAEIAYWPTVVAGYLYTLESNTILLFAALGLALPGAICYILWRRIRHKDFEDTDEAVVRQVTEILPTQISMRNIVLTAVIIEILATVWLYYELTSHLGTGDPIVVGLFLAPFLWAATPAAAIVFNR